MSEARLPVVSCTGSAYVVRLARGTEIYVWAFEPARHDLDAEETAWIRRVAGTRLYGNAIRAVWAASGRQVWVEAGPTEARLPPTGELEPLVAATVRR